MLGKLLDTAESVVAYANSIGVNLSDKEADLILGYVCEGNGYHFELSEDNKLYLIDDCYSLLEEEKYSEEAVSVISGFNDILECLSSANEEIVADTLHHMNEAASFVVSNKLNVRLNELFIDEEAISALWDREYKMSQGA